MILLLLLGLPALHAQTTAQLSGTVTDPSGALVPGAKVELVNEATQDARVVTTNNAGLYSFPALLPSTYTLKVSAKGFEPKNLTGIELHAGDQRTVPAFALTLGSESQTVTVEAAGEMIPVDNGQREDVLTAKDIENLALQGRDTTELLKVLPGATTVSGGLTQTSPSFSDLNISANESSIGNGININGVPNRGGTALLSDGVSVLDPGDMASSIGIISPEMTQEVSVQTSNFGAYQQNGPVVVSAISKSGTSHLHGEGYFDARNDALNANSWYNNHQPTKIPKGGAHYYYPGGNVGGPVPFTHNKVFLWGGYERFLQNPGSGNILTSFIPTPEMQAGDFSTDNQTLCPQGFSSSATNWCNNLANMGLPDGTALPTPAATDTNGQVIPSQFIDPGAKALAAFWPKANANPCSNGATCTGPNYIQPIDSVNNGWVYRIRMDYDLSDRDKFYVAYQQAYSSTLAQGNGAHIYWTPGNSIPAPGGGLVGQVFTKSISGHFVHTFNASTTNEFIAAWGFGSFPFGPPNQKAASKATLGYTYGSVFNASSLIPSYSSAGNQTFPDFSQGDWFEPNGYYLVRKEIPSFTDNFTKVWGRHTVKIGAFTQNTGNLQGNDGVSPNGNISSFSGEQANIITGSQVGAANNPVANFVIGNVTGYSESNSAPVSDMAYQNTAVYIDDQWKTSSRLSVEAGARFEHVGHWYDRQGVGMAVFLPQRVFSDYYSGKIDPGYYWHGIDPSIPLSGQPNRLLFVSPRFGVSYDLQGNGNTVVRGGWGVYRFVGQYNDYAPALTTAQAVQTYNLPGSKSVLLSQISQLSAPACAKPPCGITGTQNGLDASDYGVPVTYAYNLTIDHRFKWNTLLDIAYVGNKSSQLLDNGETIQGSGFGAIADQNKTPIGAFFKPDPVTGIISQNPEKLNLQPDGTKIPNTSADYRPYGYAYGTGSVYQDESTNYANYNGFQAAFLKTTGKLTFDFNFTWSKTLGTGLQNNPFNLRANYGPESIDRPFVFNSSYTYQTGQFHHGNALVRGAVGGWTISGISTWQAGGNLLAQLGNNVPNFGLSEQYTATSLASAGVAANVSPGLGVATYYGTDAPLAVQPVLTCNPNKGLAKYQRLNVACFAAPTIGTYGGKNYPYFSNGSYLDNDLALYKSFHIVKEQSVQFRISAFNWLNHPLPEFSSASQVTLNYLVDYNSKAITLNTNPASQGGTVPNFGFMDAKSGGSYERILELNVKYLF
ncbi:carboxypeptidase regulatory-like domain-containing protein [Granulicella sp. 5B5]|uniref:carboxypeptidase regulatory-like domain-containing protein n=1 Tax=Granulicella sp. 5B5 TaxID=1617967 RepID=UPI0015F77BBE|nr:carboxypeptidase regulatory-like domain-containing protein [Granulicella sp. 5B5]